MNDLQETEIQGRGKKNPPGIQLRKAREARGLSRKDIADRLHLSEKVIDAIDKDDYVHLPVPAFVRGYLRSYADLAGLNADLIVEKYNHYTDKTDGLQEGKDNLHKEVGGKRAGSLKNVKIEAYLALILFVVIGIVYLTGSESTDLNNGIDAKDSSDSSASNNTLDHMLVEAVQSNDPDRLDQNSEANGQENGNFEKIQDQPFIDEGIDEAIEKSVLSVDTANNSADNSMNVKPDATTVTSSENVFDIFQDDEEIFPVEKPAPEKTQPAGVDKLNLEFHADAWIEVHEASGDRLLYRMGREGRTYQVTGRAPFKVLLGNAREVTVMLNGQVFDQTPYIRGQVARFMAGSAKTGLNKAEPATDTNTE